jgi:hypothetical protein
VIDPVTRLNLWPTTIHSDLKREAQEAGYGKRIGDYVADCVRGMNVVEQEETWGEWTVQDTDLLDRLNSLTGRRPYAPNEWWAGRVDGRRVVMLIAHQSKRGRQHPINEKAMDDALAELEKDPAADVRVVYADRNGEPWEWERVGAAWANRGELRLGKKTLGDYRFYTRPSKRRNSRAA